MKALRLRVPATSANLGPGFDAIGLALGLYLRVDARPGSGSEFAIWARGRNADQVGALRKNLMLTTYRNVAPDAPPLSLEIENEIPLGMGCGSSAAAIVAGVMLANHFGGLGLTQQAMLERACVVEGHPDNVAACVLGGLTVSAMGEGKVNAATIPATGLPWRIFLAIPAEGLATETARGLLPETYSRADAVANVQATALLVSAFALGQGDLLATAMHDRMHQPFRAAVCPLLEKLLPLAGVGGVYGVALSGAGPSVLLLADREAEQQGLVDLIRGAAGEPVEIVETCISGGASSSGQSA